MKYIQMKHFTQFLFEKDECKDYIVSNLISEGIFLEIKISLRMNEWINVFLMKTEYCVKFCTIVVLCRYAICYFFQCESIERTQLSLHSEFWTFMMIVKIHRPIYLAPYPSLPPFTILSFNTFSYMVGPSVRMFLLPANKFLIKFNEWRK